MLECAQITEHYYPNTVRYFRNQVVQRDLIVQTVRANAEEMKKQTCIGRNYSYIELILIESYEIQAAIDQGWLLGSSKLQLGRHLNLEFNLIELIFAKSNWTITESQEENQ